MLKQIATLLLICGSLNAPVWAQGTPMEVNSAGDAGAQKRGTYTTNSWATQLFTPGNVPFVQGQTLPTGKQVGGLNSPRLAPAQTTQYGFAPGVPLNIHQLPPTRLDSFVRNAGAGAEAIYGDEGTTGNPPINGFSAGNTIGAGINQPFLSTGHASALPSAWLNTTPDGASVSVPGGYQAYPGGAFPVPVTSPVPFSLPFPGSGPSVQFTLP